MRQRPWTGRVAGAGSLLTWISADWMPGAWVAVILVNGLWNLSVSWGPTFKVTLVPSN